MGKRQTHRISYVNAGLKVPSFRRSEIPHPGGCGRFLLSDLMSQQEEPRWSARGSS